MNEHAPINELDETVVELLREYGPATFNELILYLLGGGYRLSEPALYQALDRLCRQARVRPKRLTLAGAIFEIDRGPR